ncbi:Dienelactone hydrolase family protein [Zhouia amylolytica]|uniref:Dienelactone hydrolase family protein n=1 Tax=Zhouia amylolytica TaxID=376730 RepID=A0A1I6U5Q9_9FLAO|nr:dienelactone hydrolase family protein [Zhouia amylolytica]SFS96754.1 Dienelactone hydrolase family protein [Zhouia amylolytica]
MKLLTTLLLLSICSISFAQRTKIIKAFNHHSIILKGDTINYHTYSKKSVDSTKNLLLYIQGSKAMSLYQTMEEDGKTYVGTVIPIDFKLLPEDYLLVVISKKGFPFLTDMDKEFPVPKEYYENQTLVYRAFQANQVINDLTEKHKNHFEKIIALGHSEGSDVIAKLGTINKEITHFGYWSGGGNTQFIDFVTFIRKDVVKGNLTEEQAQLKIDSLFIDLKDIMANPNATDKFWQGDKNSYKRWSSFSEPPIENLLQIDKPIFAAIGTKDQAVALESAYLIPIEFIRHQKDNLTFKAYPNLDHVFGKEIEARKFEEHLNDVFIDFLNWVNEN